MNLKLSENLRANSLILWSELVKNMKFLMAYPVVFVFWTIFPIFWFIPRILQGQAFVGGLQSLEFEKLTGTSDFVAFLIIGGILNSYVLTSLYGVGESMRREAYRGTLDYLLSSPCNKAFILIGKALSESISSILYTLTQVAVSIIFFGIVITLEVIAPLLLILILLILGLYGIALMLAAISLQFKQAHELAHTLENVFYTFSPVAYPRTMLPSWAQMVSAILPLTYALIAVRSLTLLKYDITVLYYEILVLFIIDIAAIFLGFYLFNRMEEKTKKSGTISHY